MDILITRISLWRKFCLSVMFIVLSFNFMSAQNNIKRDLQKLKDSSSIHSGQFKGYALVYVYDFLTDTYQYAVKYTDDIWGYPVYMRNDKTYYIRYKDQKCVLQKLETPISVNGYLNLKWRIDYRTYIEDIPTSW